MYERNCVFIDIDDTIGMIAYTYPIETSTWKDRKKLNYYNKIYQKNWNSKIKFEIYYKFHFLYIHFS